MANPIKMVPMNNVGTPPTERIPIPIVNNTKERKSVSSIPKRRAILGANGDNKAKESKGNVVNDPDNVLEIPKLSRIEVTRGPTDVKGALRFAPRRMIPMMSSPTLGLISIFLCSS
jgi:hypothetical protein